MSYDAKCYDLACEFLSDYPSLTPEQYTRLADSIAQDVQKAIESALSAEGLS